MKPLPVAPLTLEDELAWADVNDRLWERLGGQLAMKLYRISRMADARDAALMLALQRMDENHYHPDLPAGHHIIGMT